MQPSASPAFEHRLRDEGGGLDCHSCGACCSYSAQWPRFSLEDDAALALIPDVYVDERSGGMRCVGDRCTALIGDVGVATACAVYPVRPEVCRACMPFDDECMLARRELERRSAPLDQAYPKESRDRTPCLP